MLSKDAIKRFSTSTRKSSLCFSLAGGISLRSSKSNISGWKSLYCCASLQSTVLPFLPNMSQYPRTTEQQQHYISLIMDAIDSAWKDTKQPGANLRTSITLLLPDLNPALDIYDRRFLLRMVWGVVSHLVLKENQRVRIAVQSPMGGSGLPLAVAGLLRYLNADYLESSNVWNGKLHSHVSISTVDYCISTPVEEDCFVIVTPTNAVSAPVIEQIMQLTDRYKSKSIILINPNLQDVPSTGGIMQVQGRKERIEFLNSFHCIFYLRPLYKTGTLYPVKGVLYRAYPSLWQIWQRQTSTWQQKEHEEYKLLEECHQMPPREKLSEIFFQKSRKTETNKTKDTETFLYPQLLFFLVVALLLTAFLMLRGHNATNIMAIEATNLSDVTVTSLLQYFRIHCI